VDGVGRIKDRILEMWPVRKIIRRWLEERVHVEIDIEKCAFEGSQNRGVYRI